VAVLAALIRQFALLVEYAVNNLCEGAKILDLCTGSGCIAISILAERKDICAVATDISEATLAVARENALKNDVSDRIVFVREDALCPSEVMSCAPFDAVISNPPYIPTEHINGLSPEVKKEPHRALDGGDDGLVFYRNITEKYGSLLSDEGFILYEIGYDQEEAIKQIAQKNGYYCEVADDVGKIPRMAYLKKNK
jgi:release factor glutamine methyltransferase